MNEIKFITEFIKITRKSIWSISQEEEKFISKDQGVSSGGVFISFFQMFLLTKIEIFFQKQTPRENHLATHCLLTFIRVTIYGFIKINKKMRGSKVAFFLQTFEIINKKIAINTDTLINSTDDGLSWRSQSECSNKCFRIWEISFCEISF